MISTIIILQQANFTPNLGDAFINRNIINEHVLMWSGSVMFQNISRFKAFFSCLV